MSTQDHPHKDGTPAVAGNPQGAEKVRGIFATLAKLVNAQAIYERNNPNLINFARLFEESFRSFFEDEKELLLTVTQYQLLWRDHVVYDIGASTDSLAFILYKDGVGEISIHAQVQRAELERFVEILKCELHSPSTQHDVVTRLWQAEFDNIFYRVLDEQPESADGDSEGAGSATSEQRLGAGDHQDIASHADTPYADSSLETLGEHLHTLISRSTPPADATEQEARLQNLLAAQFDVGAEELSNWDEATRRSGADDDLVSLLDVMLDFAQARHTPPVIRDVTDAIERIVHYIIEEARVSTLRETLDLIGSIDRNKMGVGFASLPDRIEAKITNEVYLLRLAKGASQSTHDAREVLSFLQLAGRNAVAGFCELLSGSTDPVIHEEVCASLIEVAPENIPQITNGFDLEDARLARDAVWLLCQFPATELPPVVQKILSSSDPRVRECAAAFLIHSGSDESAEAFRQLLRDSDESVRIKMFTAAERFPHPWVVEEVTASCFEEQETPKSVDELEHMYRALGKLGGENVIPSLKQTFAKRGWLPGAKSRKRRNKLLAITALRYIPGDEARQTLQTLCDDADHLVATKSRHMLKQRTDHGVECDDRPEGIRK